MLLISKAKWYSLQSTFLFHKNKLTLYNIGIAKIQHWYTYYDIEYKFTKFIVYRPSLSKISLKAKKGLKIFDHIKD